MRIVFGDPLHTSSARSSADQSATIGPHSTSIKQEAPSVGSDVVELVNSLLRAARPPLLPDGSPDW